MRSRLTRLIGPAAIVVLVLLSAACIVAVEDRPPGRVHVPPPAPPPPPLPPPMADDYGVFYDDLDPYGDWGWVDPYGWVWNPTRVAPGWRPYTAGGWISTEDGWLWETDEPWGWATYHYGRWAFDPFRGWVWIPGREWAPAWVAWRHGDGWIGWAPLPPRAVWRVGVGLDLGGVDIDVIIQPFWWGFVEERMFLDRRLGPRIVPPGRNVTLVRVTRNVTRYTVVRDRVVVRGIDVDAVERVGRRKVVPYRIVDDDRERDRHPKVVGQEVRVFRPTVKEAPPARAPRRALPREDSSSAGEEPDRGGSRSIPTDLREVPRRAPVAERPAPPRPVEPGTPPAVTQEVLRRQQSEQRELDRRMAAERDRLERLQRQDARRAPAGVAPGELKKRHEEELRAHQEEAAREKQVLEKKQERERKTKAEEPAKDEKKRPVRKKETADRKGD